MGATDVVRQISETLGATATAKSIFGEPIHAEGRIVVPIARVAYGFGGGFGAGHGKDLSKPAQNDDAHAGREGEGGGGGGGVAAFPAGALEITPTGTRFIALQDYRPLAAAFCFGLAIGGLLLGRRARR